MEPQIPVNYLPPGRNKVVDEFGFVTNKNLYEWLHDSSLATARYEDLLMKTSPESKSYITEQRKKIEQLQKINKLDPYKQNHRSEELWSQDVYTDESKHHYLYNLKL